MEDVIALIDGKEFTLEIVETPEDRYDGLAGIDDIDDNEGMLFIFDAVGPQPMVMRGMEVPIHILHVSQDGFINASATGNPGDTNEYTGTEDTFYVIEIPAEGNSLPTVGSNVELPAELAKYIADTRAVGMAKNGATAQAMDSRSLKKYNIKTTDIPEQKDRLQILDNDGKVIANIDEGARIFSREHTKALVDLVKLGNDEESLKKLGKLMVDIIHKQDNQAPQYTD